jgi:hypothetical protein
VIEYYDTQCNCSVSTEQRIANMLAALERGLPVVEKLAPNNRSLAIIGGGVSVADDVEELKAFKGDIWAVNGSHDWALDQGIKLTGFVMVDPEPIMIKYVQKPREGIAYYIGSICHPGVFDALDGYDVRMWHAGSDDCIPPKGKGGMIGGGPSVMTRAPLLAFALGYRDVHLHGADSSYEGARHHIYDAADDPRIRILLDDVLYETCILYVHQAAYFQQIAHFYESKMALFAIHGRGMGPAMLRAKMHSVEDIERDAQANSHAA